MDYQANLEDASSPSSLPPTTNRARLAQRSKRRLEYPQPASVSAQRRSTLPDNIVFV